MKRFSMKRFTVKRLTTLLVFTCLCALTAAPAWSQNGPGRGFGRGQGRHQHDERHDADRDVFQYLLQHHKQITRSVTELPNGVETLTESDVPEVAAKLKEHVKWMEYRIENVNPIRMRDPLFAELFKHAKQIKMMHVETEKGVRVTETSTDPDVVKLIQAHAKVVTGFVERGFAEAMKNHAVPSDTPASPAKPAKPAKLTHPVIAEYGGVVRMPNAAMQPRNGTKLLVDITRGSDPAKLNSALEKVAKYLNIYAGAGAEPASAEIALVFHGDATLIVLNPDAYAKTFQTKTNPNLELLRKLHQADVEMYVCGQTLLSKGAKPEQVAVFVETAVSALTAVVNLQADGYAFLPLGN